MTELKLDQQPWHDYLLIERSRLRRISDIALPSIAGALAINVMTFVDTLMVGQLGDAALGGVGIGGQLFFLYLAIALGLGAGVQAMVARRVGEGRIAVTGEILNAGILAAVLLSLLLILFAYLTLPIVFGLLNNSATVVDEGLAYLSTRIPSILFLAVNVAFRSYWVGVSLAKYSMISILTLSIANIIFNYLLIFGHYGAPQMGVAGAGLGSTLALITGLSVNIVLAFKHARGNGFLRGLPGTEHMQTMVRIAWPDSLRQALFSVGVVAMYVLIGQIGTRELAAFHVIISICLIAYMPHIGIGAAATTLVGEALGRKDAVDASIWGWQVSTTGFCVLTLLALGVLVFPSELLGLFLVDPITLALAVVPLQIAVLAHVLDGYGKILAAALIGAGATRVAMQLTLLPQWLLFLAPLSVSVLMGHGLITGMTLFLMSTIIASLLFIKVWQRGEWRAVAV